MIRSGGNNLMGSSLVARVVGVVALVVTPLFCFAPAALAATPTASGGFVTNTGSSDETDQRTRSTTFKAHSSSRFGRRGPPTGVQTTKPRSSISELFLSSSALSDRRTSAS